MLLSGPVVWRYDLLLSTSCGIWLNARLDPELADHKKFLFLVASGSCCNFVMPYLGALTLSYTDVDPMLSGGYWFWTSWVSKVFICPLVLCSLTTLELVDLPNWCAFPDLCNVNHGLTKSVPKFFTELYHVCSILRNFMTKNWIVFFPGKELK